MAQMAAHRADHVIAHVPVRQWLLIGVMRLPIPLRLLLAAQPKRVTPVLQVVHCVITRFLLEQAAPAADCAAICAHHRPVQLGWAKLLKRVFSCEITWVPVSLR